MLPHVGVVRRTLIGQVQGDLDAVLPRLGQEAVEILQGAQLRVYGLVSAFLGPDRPGAAGVLASRRRRGILALAMRTADGMDRRQVEHVKAHPCDVGQAGLAIPERPVPAGVRTARPRKHLVPRAVARLLAIDDDFQLFRINRA